MIARLWHGKVPKAKSAAYLDHMRTVAIPDYASIDGNRGAWSLHREDGDIVHFQMLSFWDDYDAIKKFAGEDYECEILRFRSRIPDRIRAARPALHAARLLTATTLG